MIRGENIVVCALTNKHLHVAYCGTHDIEHAKTMNDDAISLTLSVESVTPTLEHWQNRYGVAFTILGEEDKIPLFNDLSNNLLRP